MPSSSDWPDDQGDAVGVPLARRVLAGYHSLRASNQSKAVKSIAQELSADLIGVRPHGRAEIQDNQDAPLPTARA